MKPCVCGIGWLSSWSEMPPAPGVHVARLSGASLFSLFKLVKLLKELTKLKRSTGRANKYCLSIMIQRQGTEGGREMGRERNRQRKRHIASEPAVEYKLLSGEWPFLIFPKLGLAASGRCLTSDQHPRPFIKGPTLH